MAFWSHRNQPAVVKFRPRVETLEDRRAPAIDVVGSAMVGGPEPPPDGVAITGQPVTAGPPTATFALDGAVHGKKVKVAFTDPSDPVYSDEEAGFKYSVAFNGEDLDQIVPDDDADASHKFKTPGTYTIRGRIYNKDGLYTEYSTTVTVQRRPIFITGADAGGGPHVKVFHPNGAVKFSFFAYSPLFTGGVAVAQGDLNDDGVPDIITAAGPGGGPHVRVLDGVTLSQIAGFYAFPANFSGGVSVAVGDVNGDGRADLIVGMASQGSEIKVIDGTKLDKLGTPDALQALMFSFTAFAGHTGGVNVAAGDVNGDGFADLIAGTASFGGQVRVFSGATSSLLRSFDAFGVFNKAGVTVAAANLDGDNKAEIIVGHESGNGAQLRVIRGSDSRVVASLVPFSVSTQAVFPGIAGGIPNGVRCAVTDLDGDGIHELVVASRRGFKPRVHIYKELGKHKLFDFDAYTMHFMGGVFVG